MIKTVLTIRTLILLLALGFPAQLLAITITCSVSGVNPYCAGSTLTVSYNGAPTTFLADNVFTVQLSDATGSFTSPAAIGTLASTSSISSISATLPAGASGAAYRIRVVSSSPAAVGSDNGSNITITSVIVPAIVITADPSTPVGAGSTVYFSSTITGGGASPTYQWTRNGIAAGTSTSLLITDPKDEDAVKATLTSSATCAQPRSVDSNTITLDLQDSVTQSNHAWAPRSGQIDVAGTIIRINGSGFSIGTKGYIGLGYVGSTANLRKDFWEYDPATDAWTQKATFGGAARYNAVGFSVSGKGYIGTGATAGGVVKDFYQFDPLTNSWKVRASLPSAGAAREQAFAFAVGIKAYVGGGYTGTLDLSDFYEFDPSANTWTAKANITGGKRYGVAAFAIDNKGYIAGGYSSSSAVWYKDLWDYDPGSNAWTQHADMPSDGRVSATGFSLMGSGYVGLGNTPAGYGGQLYQYTVATNSWALKQYYPGPQTSNASVSMTIGNRAFVYKDGTWTEFNFFTTSSFSSKICTNETLSISFDASNFTFPPNTTFTAQVSTQSNFSVGTNLGTFNSTGSSGVVVANFLPTIPAGNYYFRIVTNNSPAFSTFSEIVKITAIPASQTINPVGGSTVCKDVAVVFTSNLTGPNFQWFKNNNLVGTDAPTYTDATLANSDVVKAVKIFTVGCSQPTAIGSNLVTMKVRTSAKPVVTTVGNTLSSTAATAYQWFENGSAISKATGQSFVITESGIYKVRTTDINGCDAFSDDLSSVFTGLFGEELSNRINTYPNPVSGEMILEVADDLVMQGANYSVLNELGQQVIASQTASVTNKINLTGRTSGLYLVRLTISGSTVVRRVVKVD